MCSCWINLTGMNYIKTLDSHLGFIYRISTNEGQYYYGRKQFWSKRNKSWVDSGWREYYSSSNSLRDYIETAGRDNVRREILAVFNTKSAIRYAEALAIILSGSYLDRDKGLNWSFEGSKGLIKLIDTDEDQMENLREKILEFHK